MHSQSECLFHFPIRTALASYICPEFLPTINLPCLSLSRIFTIARTGSPET